MTAVYDTAKYYSRILQWDEDNRLTKTVDTTAGESVATSYAYDVKGMRILKEGPYGKTIYVDTGYVETNTNVVSNHVFMGNIRVASIVKHKDETNPATYYYASDHLGSSSVLTNNTGAYHERIEYMPYGEVWVEDEASNTYSTPYKFTGKELDKETGLYYFGARYYDARMSRWISTDKYLERYLPIKGNEDINKIPGMGGVYNSFNLDLYCYVRGNPILYLDPDGHVLKEFGEWLNKEGAKVNSAITNSSVVKELHRPDTSTGKKLAVATGLSVGLTAASIGSALAAPKMIGALLTTLGKEAVKQGIKKGAVSGTIQAGANVTSNIVVNNDTSIGGNLIVGGVGFLYGSLTAVASETPCISRNLGPLLVGATGDALMQYSTSGEVDKSRVAFSGILNLLGARASSPFIQNSQPLKLGEGAAINAGIGFPLTFGTDALFLKH